MNPHGRGAALALLAALLFGATTPLIARFGDGMSPLVTAGMLYVGAALGAFVFQRLRPAAFAGRPIARRDVGCIAGMALAGAAIAPVLLVMGLARTSTVAATVALNAESLFTIALAILLYGEPWRGRVAYGMAAMVLGGVLVALDQNATGAGGGLLGLALVLGATFAWGVDNTLSRAVSEVSPLSVVALKGALGATLTLGLAAVRGELATDPVAALSLGVVGATGYGASLVLYLLAQRRLGGARTASIFGLAPFIGTLLALALGDRDAGWWTLGGALLFGLGIWFHTDEKHEHPHHHEALTHDHVHRHDDGHHDHTHEPPVAGAHSHLHHHAAMTHTHPHAPDIHHRHAHG